MGPEVRGQGLRAGPGSFTDTSEQEAPLHIRPAPGRASQVPSGLSGGPARGHTCRQVWEQHLWPGQARLGMRPTQVLGTTAGPRLGDYRRPLWFLGKGAAIGLLSRTDLFF